MRRKIHWLPGGTVTACGRFVMEEGVTVAPHWQEVTCGKCLRPTARAMAELHAEALITNHERGLPRACPDGSGRVAPDGYHWARNARFGGYQLEPDGTPWALSVSSEAYWQN